MTERRIPVSQDVQLAVRNQSRTIAARKFCRRKPSLVLRWRTSARHLQDVLMTLPNSYKSRKSLGCFRASRGSRRVHTILCTIKHSFDTHTSSYRSSSCGPRVARLSLLHQFLKSPHARHFRGGGLRTRSFPHKVIRSNLSIGTPKLQWWCSIECNGSLRLFPSTVTSCEFDVPTVDSDQTEDLWHEVLDYDEGLLRATGGELELVPEPPEDFP